MFSLAVPWWELIVRALVVYVFLLVLLRITGKRQVGQLAPFDLVLLLVLSNAVQNSMNGGDNSLIGGLLVAATLVALNFAVGYATFRSKKLESLIEGRPQVLIHNGKLIQEVVTNANLSHHEIQAALRQGGCTCIDEVHVAVLENNGAISVIAKSGPIDRPDSSAAERAAIAL
ncbi:MAG: YetF domain-containing protein [Gemmatimonadota bacterium]